MKFEKFESVGNDFVMLSATDIPRTEFEARESNLLSTLARKLCDRKFGIGADGLLLLDDESSPIALRMFNPDGTEDFCGNGLRCAAHRLMLHGNLEKEIQIRHGGYDVPVSISAGGWIDVPLPFSTFDPERVPLTNRSELFDSPLTVNGKTLTVSSLSTGSTHTVIFLDGPVTEKEFQEVSPALEHHPLFPLRTSVIWVWRPLPDEFGDGLPAGLKAEQALQIRIWERGAGETLGCGTGSAAVGAWWFRKHTRELVVAVLNPGGPTVVSRGYKSSVVVSAKAKRIYSGSLHESQLVGLSVPYLV